MCGVVLVLCCGELFCAASCCVTLCCVGWVLVTAFKSPSFALLEFPSGGAWIGVGCGRRRGSERGATGNCGREGGEEK